MRNNFLKTNKIIFLLFIMLSANLHAGYKTYIVKKGDTLFSIAKKYNTSVDKLRYINNLKNNNIKIGQKLNIPAITTKKIIYHRVKKGETLWRIAYKYNVSIQALMEWNKIKNVSSLKAGQILKIYTYSNYQSRHKNNPKTKLYSKFYPPVKGKILKDDLGKGINIKCRNSARVYASADGYVEYVGQLIGYKNVIIINHKNNTYTIYGGLGKILVKKGQKVRKKQLMAYVSKMPHYNYPVLHFEIIYKGKNIDPTKYIK